MVLLSYSAFAPQKRIKTVTKLLADGSEVHCKELKTSVLKTHLLLFCFSFLRMMTLYRHGVAKTLSPPVNNLSNSSSWPKHLYSYQLRIISISTSRSIHSPFVAAETWWCPGSCSLGWPDLAQLGWICPVPASVTPAAVPPSPSQGGNTTPDPTGHHWPILPDPCATHRAQAEHKSWAGWAATANTRGEPSTLKFLL